MQSIEHLPNISLRGVMRVEKKIFLSADIEGCAAVSSRLATHASGCEWPAARRWMTDEVVAVAQAAFAAGYGEVIATDSHGNAHNIDPESLPNNVWLVRSWPRPLLHMQGIDDPGIAACAFTGLHAASTTPNSVLAHTYFGRAFRTIRLNGEIGSEGYLNAALAGEFGVPVIFVSGDEQTIEDAARYAPNAVRFVTKRSVGVRSQMSLPPSQVKSMIGDAMTMALARPLPAAFHLSPPFALELEMTTHLAAEVLAYLPEVERTNAWTVSRTFGTLVDVMRFISFAIFYSPLGEVPL